VALVGPLGEAAYYGYDELDRLVSLRADALGLDAATYYSYDALGRRTALTDAEFHTTSFAYDALGHLLSEQDALGKTEYYSYDAAGNLVMLTNGDGHTAYYSFDAASRLTAIAFPDGVAPSFSYDAAGRLTSAYQSSPSYESDSFECDPAGRLIARTNWAYGGTLYFQYDAAGRRTAVADPKGGVVYYAYDSRGLITRVDASWGSTFYTFDARGALLTRRLPNNSCTYYTYDAAGRLAKLEDRWDDGQAIQTFEFARDANGNITRSLRQDASCWYYDYDGLQRLTGADWKDAGGSTLYAFEYEYDKVGNRLRFAQNGVSTYYSYNEANELVSEVTPGSDTAYYAFDGRGNQIRREVLGGNTLYFEYNSRNLITSICSTDPCFTPNYFEYNGLGQRVKKVHSTGTTRYLWDGLNILLETDASGNLTRRYTHGYTPIEAVSSLIAVEGPIRCPCFYHFDQVGGVRQLTDPYHNIIKSYAYEPFGRILAESGSAPNDFTFPATYVEVPGFHDLGLSPTRLYDVKGGRYHSRDVLPQAGRYHGLEGRPTLAVDPSGAQEGQVVPGLKEQYIMQLVSYLEQQAQEVSKVVPKHSGAIVPPDPVKLRAAVEKCYVTWTAKEKKDVKGKEAGALFKPDPMEILIVGPQQSPPGKGELLEEAMHAAVYLQDRSTRKVTASDPGDKWLWQDNALPGLAELIYGSWSWRLKRLAAELDKGRKADPEWAKGSWKWIKVNIAERLKPLRTVVQVMEKATGMKVSLPALARYYRDKYTGKCIGDKTIEYVIPWTDETYDPAYVAPWEAK
jgi:YD repeat-containing protein